MILLLHPHRRSQQNIGCFHPHQREKDSLFLFSRITFPRTSHRSLYLSFSILSPPTVNVFVSFCDFSLFLSVFRLQRLDSHSSDFIYFCCCSSLFLSLLFAIPLIPSVSLLCLSCVSLFVRLSFCPVCESLL